MNQDRFYRITEANSFYNRWKNQKKEFNNSKKIIRPYKKKILKILERNIDIRKKKILEIGCFISDLLNVLKKEYGCKVYGIEPSSLACSFARKYYKLNIENSTLLTSKLFNLNIQNKGKFDENATNDLGDKKKFFFLGPKNNWKNYLKEENLIKLTKEFDEEMRELGYL